MDSIFWWIGSSVDLDELSWLPAGGAEVTEVFKSIVSRGPMRSKFDTHWLHSVPCEGQRALRAATPIADGATVGRRHGLHDRPPYRAIVVALRRRFSVLLR